MSGFVPDHNRQVVSDRPIGTNFEDPNQAPDYNRQGDIVQKTAEGDFTERRGRIPRESSGATSARSGSVSRSRDRSTVAEVERRSNDMRTVSQSPSRAMGARSVSTERSSSKDGYMARRSRLDTIEGIGSSVGPQTNPNAFESGRGRSRDGQRDSSRNRVASPSGATGARSVIPETAQE